MSHKFKFLFHILPLLLYASLGKYHLVKTAKKKYLVETKSLTPRTERSRINDFIKNENEPAWVDKCSLKSEGSMIQKDVPGCGGRIEMTCQGGCLRIMKILYSCREQQISNIRQLKLVRSRCERKERCVVSSSRHMFGYDVCPNALDEEMNLWIVYRCDGGHDVTRITGAEECNIQTPTPRRIIVETTTPWCAFCKRITTTPPPTTPPRTTLPPTTPTPKTTPPTTQPPTTEPPTTTPPPTTPSTPPPTTTPPHGKMVTKDIPMNTGGWMNIACSVPSIFIHKVRAGCAKGEPIQGHMTMIKTMCEGKKSCRIEPNAEMFTPKVTCSAPIGKRIMWLTYSCDGGADQTTAHGGSFLGGVFNGIGGLFGGLFG